MVKAVAEIFTTRRAFMLISFAKTIVWIELVTIPLTWLFGRRLPEGSYSALARQ